MTTDDVILKLLNAFAVALLVHVYSREELWILARKVAVLDSSVTLVARVARMSSRFPCSCLLGFEHEVSIHKRQAAVRLPSDKHERDLGVHEAAALADVVAATNCKVVINKHKLQKYYNNVYKNEQQWNHY